MKTTFRRRLQPFHRSKKALAIPVTFLVLFVSMLALMSVAYYYAIEKVNARSQLLKVSMAKQKMRAVDEAILSVLWQSSSARTLEFDDYGGVLNVQPSSNLLVVNVSDGNDISDTVFNSMIGRVVYQLPYSESADTGLFLKGDNRVILNQTGSVLTQLYIRSGNEHPEILLCYRTSASSVVLGSENNKTINNVRIQIVNLNSSQVIQLMGQVPLKISCSTIETKTTLYNVSYQLDELVVTANLEGVQGQVLVPVESDSEGAIINVELVICHVEIERWVR
jgi:hypothetical protein